MKTALPPLLHSWRARLAMALLVPLLALLAACAPEYNWRVIRSADGGYQALYPAKPTRSERTLELDGLKVTMAMEAARVGDTLFAVGAIRLPADDAALRQRLLQALQKSFSQALRAGAQQQRTVTMRSAGTPARELQALELELTGVAGDGSDGGTQRRMTVRLLGSAMHVYQVMVLESGVTSGDRAASLSEQREQFFSGFAPD